MLLEAKFIKKKLAPIKNLADLSRTTIKQLSKIGSQEEGSGEDDDHLELPDIQIKLTDSKGSKRSKKSKTKSSKKDSEAAREKRK
jgi:hypothetical protein